MLKTSSTDASKEDALAFIKSQAKGTADTGKANALAFIKEQAKQEKQAQEKVQSKIQGSVKRQPAQQSLLVSPTQKNNDVMGPSAFSHVSGSMGPVSQPVNWVENAANTARQAAIDKAQGDLNAVQRRVNHLHDVMQGDDPRAARRAEQELRAIQPIYRNMYGAYERASGLARTGTTEDQVRAASDALDQAKGNALSASLRLGAALTAKGGNPYSDNDADLQAWVQQATEESSAAHAAEQEAASQYNKLASDLQYQKYASLRERDDFLLRSGGNAADAKRWKAASFDPAKRMYANVYSRGGDNVEDISNDPYNFIQDDERSIFFYLWNTEGQKAATEYINSIKHLLNERKAQQRQKDIAGIVDSSPLAAAGMSAVSTLLNQASIAGVVDLTVQNIRRMMGDSRPIDYNTPLQAPGQITQQIRNEVSKNLEERFPKAEIPGIVNLASFAYQTGMSMADSGLQLVLNRFGVPEPVTLSLMSGGAAQQAVYDAKERGASDGQALLAGYAAGIAEYAFEKISLDKLVGSIEAKAGDTIGEKLTEKWTSNLAKKVGAGIINAGQQGLVEGSEEAFTTLANTVTDLMINGDKSELLKDIDEMGAGPALRKWITGLALDAMGGIISGVGMGAGGSVLRYAGGVAEDAASAARAAAERESGQAQAETPAEPETRTAPPTPSESNPLSKALDKFRSGEQLTKNDARRIMEDEASMQTLRDAGLARDIRPGGDGREQIRQAVESYARLNTNLLTQAQAQGNLETNTEEVVSNGRTVETPDRAAAETAGEQQPQTSFRERARAAAETQRSREILDREERRSGLGRFLAEYRANRAQRSAESQFDEQNRRANSLRNQAEARNLTFTSAAEQGVPGGAEDQTFQVMPTDMLDRNMRTAQQEAAKNGIDLRFMIGQGRVNDSSGDYNFRGWISADGKRMLIQADHSKLTWQQILDHEELHKLIKSAPGYREAVEDALLSDARLQPYLSSIVDRYAEAYNSLGVTDENEIIEELLADYRAGFDMLDIARGKAGDVRTKATARKDIRAVERRVQNAGATGTQGTGKATKRFSREYASDGSKLSPQQQEYFKDSQIRDEQGRLREVYHGTGSDDFTIFDWNKTQGRDGGWFGRGFYFTFWKGEARTYGPRVLPAYLNITNPFVFKDELLELEDYRPEDTDAESLAFMINFAEKFPELAEGRTLEVVTGWDEDGYGITKEIPWSKLRGEIEQFMQRPDFRVIEINDAYGGNADGLKYEYVVKNGPDEWDYAYSYPYMSRKDAERYRFDAAVEMLFRRGGIYHSADFHMPHTYIEDIGGEFSEALKRRGYDGVLQSREGDEIVAFYPEQIKRPDNENPTSNPDIRFSRELDRDYLSAVESGDMDTAQRMVDEAARAAGYTIKAYHGTTDDFTKFSRGEQGRNHDGYLEFGGGFYFTPSENEAREWVRRGRSGLSGKAEPKVMSVYLSPRNIINADEPIPRGAEALQRMGMSKAEANFIAGRTYRFINYLAEDKGFSNTEIQDELKSLGYDAIDATYRNSASGQYVVFDPDQIKSADPVTYDDDGQVIPVTERFDPENQDIRYSREIDPQEIAKAEYLTEQRRAGRTGGRGRKKVSRVRTHAYELGGLYNEVEAQMAETQPGEFTYDVEHEKDSMANALKRLKKDFTGETKSLPDKRDWTGEDLDTAMGILYQYRQVGRDTGDYSKFHEWSHIIQAKGTRAGEFIHGFAKYSRTATERARKAAEDLRDSTGKLTPAEQKRVQGHVNELLGAIDGAAEAAAREAVEGPQGLQLPTAKGDNQKAKDALNIIKEIHDIFALRNSKSHGVPVEDWTTETGDQLAGKISSRLNGTSSKTQTTMQTILSDLVTFAQEHALPTQEARQHRTALDRITDYMNNREAYAEAWDEAKQILRDMYADDEEKLEALESFLNATISYNGEDFDRTMYRAILESADLLGMSKQDILDLAAVGTTESVIDRIAGEFIKRVGTDDANLRDTVARHIGNLVRENNVNARLERMENRASKALDIKLQQLLRESRRTKAGAANAIAQYLINDLDISSADAAIAADHIAGHYMDRLNQRANRELERMFAERGERLKPKQRDKLLDLIRLGGLTNANVEDAVVDTLGLGKLSRAKQREITATMAQFADTLDAIEDNDPEGLRSLIRQQAAARNTKLDRMAEKVLSGETDVEYLRNLAMAQLDLIAADYKPRTAGEKISTVQIISHLLNARTAMRNLTSNQVFDMVDSLANNVGLLPDIIMGAITGQRSVGLNKSWASQQKRQGALQGAGRNLLEIALDAAPNDRNQSKYGTGGRRTFAMASSGTVGKILSQAERILGYELNTTDEFHKGSVYGETMESLARFVDRGDMTVEQAAEFATDMALYRSFQDSTVIGSILGGLKDVLNIIGTGTTNGKTIKGLPVHDFGVGDLVVKYTQVPGALIHRAIEFSPVGYLKAIYNIAQLGNLKSKGESTLAKQRAAALSIGRATTGTGLITLFALLAKAGLLRRKDDEKDKNAAALRQSQGFDGTQLNVSALGRMLSGGSLDVQEGDVLADIGFLEPLDSLMTIAALAANDPEIKAMDLYDMFRNPKTAGKMGEKSLQGIWLALEDTSAMQTLSNIYSTVRYHDEANDLPLYMQIPMEIAASSVSGFIPAPVRQIAQATDTVYRDQYRSQNLLDQTAAKVANAIPGVRQQLAPKLTPLGEEKAYQAPALNALNALLSPGNISVYHSTAVTDEFLRVYDETGEAKILPERNAPYSITINKEKYTLTPDERTQYQETRGKVTAQFADAVRKSKWYKALPPDEQAEVLNWCGNFANYVAKTAFMTERGEEYTSKTYAKYYEEWESGASPADVAAKANKQNPDGTASRSVPTLKLPTA